jgi:competence protein ComFC
MKPKILCSDFFLDIFFPNRCPSCDRVIAWNEIFCKECEDSLPYIENLPWQAIFPPEINGGKPFFDYANALFWYQDVGKSAVLSFKYRSCVKVAEYTAKRIVLKFDEDGIDDTDIVTAIPMYRRKALARGYNQAEVFAEKIAAELHKPCDFSLLKRRKSHLEQHSVGGAERFTQADKNYFANDISEKVAGKNIMLCDDICTTGATLNKCSALLKDAGAAKVYICVICRTPFKDRESSPDKQ